MLLLLAVGTAPILVNKIKQIVHPNRVEAPQAPRPQMSRDRRRGRGAGPVGVRDRPPRGADGDRHGDGDGRTERRKPEDDDLTPDVLGQPPAPRRALRDERRARRGREAEALGPPAEEDRRPVLDAALAATTSFQRTPCGVSSINAPCLLR